MKTLTILGIESSCDDTSAAVVTSDKRILSNETYTQLVQHETYGGVVPEIAARAHLEQIQSVVDTAMGKAKVSYTDLDGVAATAGPGLIGGVIVGTMFAKGIALAQNIPYIAVNHLEAHALTARLTETVKFPYLLLLVSGGHCQFAIVHAPGHYTPLGGTIDDAVGEAFDKTGKLLGLGYPAGPKIEKLAMTGDPKRFKLPKPFFRKPHCNFSFSGLKTAARQLIQEEGPFSDQDLSDFCAAFQKTISDVLVDRTQRAIELALSKEPHITSLVIGGGVAANQAIRQDLDALTSTYNLPLFFPPIALCTDNGAMIAWAGLEHLHLGRHNSLDFMPRPRWPLDEIHYDDEPKGE